MTVAVSAVVVLVAAAVVAVATKAAVEMTAPLRRMSSSSSRGGKNALQQILSSVTRYSLSRLSVSVHLLSVTWHPVPTGD